MKKLFTLVLTLAALLSSTQAWAQGLTIAGISVNTSATTTQTITGTGITGTVIYNPSDKSLTLENATINATGSYDGIYNSGVANLAIVFRGSVSITTSSTSENVAAIYCDKNTRLTTNSSLPPVVTLKNTGGGPAIKVRGATLQIWRHDMTASASNNHAICAVVYNDTKPALDVHYSQISAQGASSYYAFTGFTGGLSLSLSTLLKGYSINSTSGAILNSSNVQAQSATIYPLAKLGKLHVIGNHTLSTSNTGASAASGSASLSDNTLTLTGVNLEGASLICYAPDLKVVTSGTCSITNSGHACSVYSNTSFEGSGTLKLTSTGYSGISTYNGANVTIKMQELWAEGTSRGFYGQNSSKLIIEKYSANCVYKFAGSNDGNVYTGNLVMNDMDLSTPGAYWNKIDGYVYKSGEKQKSSNISDGGGSWFKPTSNISYTSLWVGGVHVKSSSDIQHIYSPYITAGKVTYSSDSKTLTLTDATISGQPSEAATANCAIYSQIPDLTINATGTNNWTTGFICLNLGGGGTNTIKGSGTLNITSTGTSTGAGGTAINVWNSTNLTLARSGGEMTMKAKINGFNGTPNAALTINKEGSGANYKFIGDEGDIVNIPTLTLGSGVNFWTLYRWFNADEQKVYRKDAMAKASEGGTWIRSDVTWTTYPIYIAGTQLYSSDNFGNCGGFWNKYVKGGTITYNPSTKTLTLNGAKIDINGLSNEGCVRADMGSGNTLTVDIKGTNEFKGSFAGLWFPSGNYIVQGTGTLKTNHSGSSYGMGVYQYYSNSKLTIQGDVTIEDVSNGGIGCNASSAANYSYLTIAGNATIKAKKVVGLANLTLNDGQTIVEPFKAAFNSSTHQVEANGSLAQDVVIQKVEKYDLAVCDVDVNSYNKDDILRDGGTFKYDPSIKRLTITEADIDDPDVSEGVYNYGIEGLNIAIEGENHFRVVDDVFKMKNSTSFSGNGSVKGELIANDGWGINMVEGSSAYACTLNGPSFEFTGELAVGGPTNNLVIDKGCLIFNPNSSSDATMVNINNLKFGTGMYIAKPEGGVFRGKRIRLNNNVYRGLTIICQKGDVNLDGTVTIADAVAVLNAMAGQEVPGNPNVNGDSEVSIADFVAVLNIMAGQ